MDCGEVQDAINELVSKADNCGNVSNQDFAYLMELIQAMLLCGNFMQVNSDWEATSGLPFILNKPTIPDPQIQSDWNQSNNTALDFIKNKPTIPAAQVQSDWNQANPAAASFILNKPDISAAQNNYVRQIRISTEDLPVPYYKADIMDYIENLPDAQKTIDETTSKVNVIIYNVIT